MPPLRHPHPDRRGQGENQTLHEDRHRVLPQTATLTAPSPPDHTRRPSCMRVSRTRFLAPPCAQDCTAFKPTISPTNSADEPLFQSTEAKSEDQDVRRHLPDGGEDPGVDRPDHNADAALYAAEVALGLVDVESGGAAAYEPVHAPGTLGVARQSLRCTTGSART